MHRAGTVLGCDWSGNVVQHGEDVSIELGVHVAGFVMGGTFIDSGAYAEYVKTPAVLAWIVPPGTLTHQQAATVTAGYVAHSCYSDSFLKSIPQPLHSCTMSVPSEAARPRRATKCGYGTRVGPRPRRKLYVTYQCFLSPVLSSDYHQIQRPSASTLYNWRIYRVTK